MDKPDTIPSSEPIADDAIDFDAAEQRELNQDINDALFHAFSQGWIVPPPPPATEP